MRRGRRRRLGAALRPAEGRLPLCWAGCKTQVRSASLRFLCWATLQPLCRVLKTCRVHCCGHSAITLQSLCSRSASPPKFVGSIVAGTLQNLYGHCCFDCCGHSANFNVTNSRKLEYCRVKKSRPLNFCRDFAEWSTLKKTETLQIDFRVI